MDFTQHAGVESGSHAKRSPRGGAIGKDPEKAECFLEDPLSDGILVAVFDGKRRLYGRDAYFHGKLTTAKRIVYEGRD